MFRSHPHLKVVREFQSEVEAIREAPYPLRRRAYRFGWAEPARSGRCRTQGRVMIIDALLLALRELRRNLMRASLTTLGVIIGVAAVIAMLNLHTSRRP